MRWVRHLVRLNTRELPKRAMQLKDSKTLGSSRLRWEDCVKNDTLEASEEATCGEGPGKREG